AVAPEAGDEGAKAKPRVAAVEAVSTESSEDGKTHHVEFDVIATQLARRGVEGLTFDVSLPFSQSGNEFSKELNGLETQLEFGLPNLWKWVLKAVVAALLALLTPCVFPMIPVTVSFFTKQAGNANQSPLLLPSVYVIGIIASFVVIGTAFTAVFGAAGGQILATNGYLQGFFGILFVLFSLSLFGVFTLRPPSFLMA
ncbi:MAG: hypothetical protein KDC70_20055, partial [Saprospiraceae bacterium]|nr:hypothetical protein [Saprospiraceae bacterium]